MKSIASHSPGLKETKSSKSAETSLIESKADSSTAPTKIETLITQVAEKSIAETPIAETPIVETPIVETMETQSENVVEESLLVKSDSMFQEKTTTENEIETEQEQTEQDPVQHDQEPKTDQDTATSSPSDSSDPPDEPLIEIVIGSSTENTKETQFYDEELGSFKYDQLLPTNSSNTTTQSNNKGQIDTRLLALKKRNFSLNDLVKCPHDDHTYAISDASLLLAPSVASHQYNPTANADSDSKQG